MRLGFISVLSLLGFPNLQVATRSFATKFQRLGLPNRGFHMESIANIDFPWESFLMNFGIVFCRFLKALGAAFLILGLENRLENEAFFSEKTDPEPLIW